MLKHAAGFRLYSFRKDQDSHSSIALYAYATCTVQISQYCSTDLAAVQYMYYAYQPPVDHYS